MLPDHESEGRMAREVSVLRDAVKDGVNASREALGVWLRHSDSGPLAEAVGRAAEGMTRSIAESDDREPGPAVTLLIRLLLVAIVEEMGRPHVLNLN